MKTEEIISSKGEKIERRVGGSLGRLALHCSELRLSHPKTRDLLSLRSPLPPSFDHFMRRNQQQAKTLNSSFIMMEDGEKVETVGEGREVLRNVKMFTLNEFLQQSQAEQEEKELGNIKNKNYRKKKKRKRL